MTLMTLAQIRHEVTMEDIAATQETEGPHTADCWESVGSFVAHKTEGPCVEAANALKRYLTNLVEVEECITGCGDPVESRNGKAVGCLHGEECHTIQDGCF